MTRHFNLLAHVNVQSSVWPYFQSPYTLNSLSKSWLDMQTSAPWMVISWGGPPPVGAQLWCPPVNSHAQPSPVIKKTSENHLIRQTSDSADWSTFLYTDIWELCSKRFFLSVKKQSFLFSLIQGTLDGFLLSVCGGCWVPLWGKSKARSPLAHTVPSGELQKAPPSSGDECTRRLARSVQMGFRPPLFHGTGWPCAVNGVHNCTRWHGQVCKKINQKGCGKGNDD